MSASETRLDPAYTARFGCGELHAVFYQHKGDQGGTCATAMVQIPEASRRQIKATLAWARANRARLSFVCDTGDQVQQMQDIAARLLPDHRPVSMERAEAGAWGQPQ